MKLQMGNDYRSSNGSTMAGKVQKHMFEESDKTEVLLKRLKYLTVMVVIIGVLAVASLGLALTLIFKDKETTYRTSVWRGEVVEVLQELKNNQKSPPNPAEVNDSNRPTPADKGRTYKVPVNPLPTNTESKEDDLHDAGDPVIPPSPKVVVIHPDLEDTIPIDNALECDDGDYPCMGGSGDGADPDEECPYLIPPVCPLSVDICYQDINGCQVPVCCDSTL